MLRLPLYLISVFGVVALVACRGLSPAETKLIGTWEQFTIEGPLDITLKSDHTWVLEGGIAEGPIYGRWHVEADDIVMDYHADAIGVHDTTRQSLRDFARGHSRILPKIPPRLSDSDVIRLATSAARRKNINVEELSIPIISYDRSEEEGTWRVWWYKKPFRLDMTPRDRVVGATINDRTSQVSLVHMK
jgi:hypothetical protein